MYRKRMSEALQEARAYTAVNEVMVFKGGRGMNVSKQDLPVFKAKGWKLKKELEEKVEYIEYKFRNSRQAVDAVRFVQSMNTGVPRNLDINSDGENRGIIAFDAGKDDFTKVHKMIVQRFRPQILTVENKEKDLEEAFTRKDFEKLESTNDHTEAAKKLIDMFGTSDEKKEMNDIKARHEKTGYINGKDYSKRQMMVNKYYSKLK